MTDPDARHAHKTVHRRQDGFKAHIAIEPDTGMITDCAVTKASGEHSGDAQVGPGLLAGEPGPVEVLADSAYGSGDARQELTDAGHETIIKPIPLRGAVPGGFTLDDFIVDEDADCHLPERADPQDTPSRTVTFGAGCTGCSFRAQCTTSRTGRPWSCTTTRRSCGPPGGKPRPPNSKRFTASTDRWSNGPSPGSPEGTGGSATAGSTKNDHWLHHRVAGLNLRRLLALGLARINGTWVIATA